MTPPVTPGPRRLPRRLVQLYLGLALYAVSMGLFVQARLGVMPWDVLHQGIAGRLPVSFGTVTIAVGALVLLGWIPLRQRPGLGTVSNVIVIGLVVDVVLHVLAPPGAMAVRVAFLVLGVVLNAVATALYIGAHSARAPVTASWPASWPGSAGRRGWCGRCSRSPSWRSGGCSAARSGSARWSTRSRSAPSCTRCCPCCGSPRAPPRHPGRGPPRVTGWR